MAYELPMDLIRQAKTATRAEAGLSDYDLNGDISPLPSLSEAVAAFDPSPPYLRCKNCKGRLLRGVQSLLCIYCGRPNDVPPDPISFKDTFAYRWLLESLHFDGSEIVGPTTKKSEFSRGQSTPKGQIPLSDFLNLKITWPSEMEKKEIMLNKKTQERSSINLTGVDLDNFFSGSQMLYAFDRPEEHSFRHKHVEAAEVEEPATHSNLSFFENMQSSNLAVHHSESKDGVETAEAKEAANPDDLRFFQNVKPVELASHTSIDRDDDAFSGWEATFQSADSGDQLDSSKTFDSFISSGDQYETSKSSDPFSGSTVDLSSQLDSVFGPRADLKDGKTQVGAAASTSMDDWNDDLWKNLSSNVSQQMGQPDSSVGVKNDVPSGDQHETSKSSGPFSGSRVDLSSQLGSIFGPSADLKDGKTQVGTAASTSMDDLNDDLWNNLSSNVSQQMGQPDSSVGVKHDVSQDAKEFDMFEVDQWQSNDANASGSTIHRDDESFIDWNDFASSTSVNVSYENSAMQSHNQPIATSGETSDLKLLSTDDKFEEIDFGSFSQAVPFPSSSSKEDISAAMTVSGPEVSYSESDTGRGPEQPARDGDVKTAGREEVERILSQMHDLSFMLENNLSLPPKSNDLRS